MDEEQTVPIATCATACQLLSYYKLLQDMMSDYCFKKMTGMDILRGNSRTRSKNKDKKARIKVNADLFRSNKSTHKCWTFQMLSRAHTHSMNIEVSE